jgi:hypothetical protein
MLEAELTEHLGYERYEAKGRNSGNSRNGKHLQQVRTSAGDTTIAAACLRLFWADRTYRSGLVEEQAACAFCSK